MVFSSFPVYLDHPNSHQFQQQGNNTQQGSGGVENPQLIPPPPPPLQGGNSDGGGGGSIRPGSLVDRARLAKIPLPEAGLKCPRCDSTNTKFCYFNNYNLSQPRHFCKTCRRYWTRGGALRSVPVGGGCRRNKRTKSGSNSKSSTTAANDRQMSTNNASPSSCNTQMASQLSQSSSQLPFMAALQSFNHYGGGVNPGFHPQMVPGNGITDNGFNNNNNISSSSEQWKFPSLASFEPSTNFFSFQNEGVEIASSMVGDHHHRRLIPSSSSGVSQMASVKMERNQELNLSKQFLGDSSVINQHWTAANTWSTGFSGLNSSSSSHLL